MKICTLGKCKLCVYSYSQLTTQIINGRAPRTCYNTKTMHIGILGSSFNPPHLGHELMYRQVLDFTNIEKIWLLPVFKHTFTKELAPVDERLAMSRLLENQQIEVSTLEIEHKLSGNTIEIIPYLHKNHAGDHFTFIIGSDQLPDFHKWGRWQELLTQIPFLVVPRAGFPTKPLYKGMTVLTHPLLVTSNISSTIVRNRIKLDLPIDGLVNKKVADYIQKHKLYE